MGSGHTWGQDAWAQHTPRSHRPHLRPHGCASPLRPTARSAEPPSPPTWRMADAALPPPSQVSAAPRRPPTPPHPPLFPISTSALQAMRCCASRCSWWLCPVPAVGGGRWTGCSHCCAWRCCRLCWASSASICTAKPAAPKRPRRGRRRRRGTKPKRNKAPLGVCSCAACGSHGGVGVRRIPPPPPHPQNGSRAPMKGRCCAELKARSRESRAGLCEQQCDLEALRAQLGSFMAPHGFEAQPSAPRRDPQRRAVPGGRGAAGRPGCVAGRLWARGSRC